MRLSDYGQSLSVHVFVARNFLLIFYRYIVLESTYSKLWLIFILI